jgi:hypothetical protein
VQVIYNIFEQELHEHAWLRGFWYSGKYYLCQVMGWLIDA